MLAGTVDCLDGAYVCMYAHFVAIWLPGGDRLAGRCPFKFLKQRALIDVPPMASRLPVLQDRWLSLYGHRLGLTPAAPRKQELRRQLAKEVAGQLFSPIDWDNV